MLNNYTINISDDELLKVPCLIFVSLRAPHNQLSLTRQTKCAGDMAATGDTAATCPGKVAGRATWPSAFGSVRLNTGSTGALERKDASSKNSLESK